MGIFRDVTEEEINSCYNNQEERLSDESDIYTKNLDTGELEHSRSCGLSTISHLAFKLKGYDFFFDIKAIQEKDRKDYPKMEEWQINANFYGINIMTDEGWQEYLKQGDHNWLDNIDKFGREYIENLERPLIFRRLLCVYGDHYSLDDWQNLRDIYLEETEYAYNIFLKYSETLGFIDDEFKEFEL